MRIIIVMAMQTILMDQLHVLLKPSIGLGSRVPPVANGPFNYLNLFIIYRKKHDTSGYHKGHKPIGPERKYGERQVIQCRAGIKKHKIVLSVI